MLSSQFSNMRNTRFDQSSPVQPISESRGGSTNVTQGRSPDEGNPCVFYGIYIIIFFFKLCPFLRKKNCIFLKFVCHIQKILSKHPMKSKTIQLIQINSRTTLVTISQYFSVNISVLLSTNITKVSQYSLYILLSYLVVSFMLQYYLKGTY